MILRKYYWDKQTVLFHQGPSLGTTAIKSNGKEKGYISAQGRRKMLKFSKDRSRGFSS